MDTIVPVAVSASVAVVGPVDLVASAVVTVDMDAAASVAVIVTWSCHGRGFGAVVVCLWPWP